MKRIAKIFTNPDYHYEKNNLVPRNKIVYATEVSWENIPKTSQKKITKYWQPWVLKNATYIKYDPDVVKYYKAKDPYSFCESKFFVDKVPDINDLNSLCKWYYIA